MKKQRSITELSAEFTEAMYKVGLISKKDYAKYMRTFSGKVYQCQ